MRIRPLQQACQPVDHLTNTKLANLIKYDGLGGFTCCLVFFWGGQCGENWVSLDSTLSMFTFTFRMHWQLRAYPLPSTPHHWSTQQVYLGDLCPPSPFHSPTASIDRIQCSFLELEYCKPVSMYIVHSQSSFCFIVPTSRSGQKHWRAGQKRAVMNLAHDPIPGNVYFPWKAYIIHILVLIGK